MKGVNRLGLDIELTNRCNAICNFCPRDKTPAQGFMSEETFRQAVFRAREAGLRVMMAGQGESLLHPRFENLVPVFNELGVIFAMTTNASLLTEEKARFLLDQNIYRLTFSVSDIGDDYEEVYNLDYENTIANIDRFMALAKGKCEIWISVVEHDINHGKIKEIKRFWEGKGVTGVYTYRQISRGGACNGGFNFVNSDRFMRESEQLMTEYGVSSLCNLAFTAPFVGWNGNYYVCCSDYEKMTPLGTVFDYSIDELDQVKLGSMARGNPACISCNYEPQNSIRELMFDVEMKRADEAQLVSRLKLMHKEQASNPVLYGNLNWKDCIAKSS